jgi:hypothetical protein
MYLLSLSVTGLTPCPVVPVLGNGLAITALVGSAAVATAMPASSSKLRRERIAGPFSSGLHLFRSSLMLSPSESTLLWLDLAQGWSGAKDKSVLEIMSLTTANT